MAGLTLLAAPGPRRPGGPAADVLIPFAAAVGLCLWSSAVSAGTGGADDGASGTDAVDGTSFWPASYKSMRQLS